MRNKILYSIIIFLSVVIISGTAVGLLKGHRPAENLRNTDPSPNEISSLNKRTDNRVAAYTDLGQIRAVTKPEDNDDKESSIAVVITPWLSYPEGDTVFFEELSRKRLVIKGIFQTFFSDHTQKELQTLTEPVIKNLILEEINQKLSLGKISAVYFSEYIFLQ